MSKRITLYVDSAGAVWAADREGAVEAYAVAQIDDDDFRNIVGYGRASGRYSHTDLEPDYVQHPAEIDGPAWAWLDWPDFDPALFGAVTLTIDPEVMARYPSTWQFLLGAGFDSVTVSGGPASAPVMTVGVVRSVRPADWNEETGWYAYGKWQDALGVVYGPGLTPIRWIREGEHLATDWIITLGNGRHFFAEVAVTCLRCGEPITPDMATPRGVCEHHR